MFLLDLLGTTAIIAGGGYVAVLGTVEAVSRFRRAAKRAIVREVVDAQGGEESHNLAGKIAQLLRGRPNEWSFEQHTVHHRPTGLKIWISNGRSYVGVWQAASGGPTDVGGRYPFSWFEKCEIWAAYKAVAHRCKANAARSAKSDLIGVLDQHLGGQA